MAEALAKTATYADIEALPENLVGEILFGHLVTSPRPSPRHAFAASVLGAELVGPFQKGSGGPGGWIIIDEPEVHFGDHIVVPDIAGWRQARLPTLPDTAWFETPPDWVCEVLSSSTEKFDRGDKRRIYADHGVDHLWFVDPRPRTLEVFVRQDKDWLLTHTFVERADVTAPPFEAMTFSLGLLWPLDPPDDGTPAP